MPFVSLGLDGHAGGGASTSTYRQAQGVDIEGSAGQKGEAETSGGVGQVARCHRRGLARKKIKGWLLLS